MAVIRLIDTKYFIKTTFRKIKKDNQILADSYELLTEWYTVDLQRIKKEEKGGGRGGRLPDTHITIISYAFLEFLRKKSDRINFKREDVDEYIVKNNFNSSKYPGYDNIDPKDEKERIKAIHQNIQKYIGTEKGKYSPVILKSLFYREDHKIEATFEGLNLDISSQEQVATNIISETKSDSNIVHLLDGKSVLSLKKVLGEGKSGYVYSAEVLWPVLNLMKGDVIAVKFYKDYIFSQPRFINKVKKEAELSSRIFHHNLVRIFGLLETKRGKCLIMEYIHGNTLRHALDNNLVKEPINLCLQILEGLSALHRNGLIHRDLKPENLLLDNYQAVLKISDFGAIYSLKDVDNISYSDSHLSSIRYNAPEYLFDGKASFQSDQYSAGAIIYEILLREPFINPTGTIATQVLKVKESKASFHIDIKLSTHEQIIRFILLEILLNENTTPHFDNTEDLYHAFKNTYNSNWFKRLIENYKHAYRNVISKNDELIVKSKKILNQLHEESKYSQACDDAEMGITVSGHSDDPYIGIECCLVCNEYTFVVVNIDGSGYCGVCDYSRTSEFMFWNILLESFTLNDSLFFNLTLANAMKIRRISNLQLKELILQLKKIPHS